MRYFRINTSWTSFIFFLGLGTSVFYVNSRLDLPYFAKGYVALLTSQSLLFLVFLLARKTKAGGQIKDNKNFNTKE